MEKEQIYKYAPLWSSWEIEELVGEGSFGSVYKVFREEMGHKYYAAVKIISVPTKEQLREAQRTLGNDEATLTYYFEDAVKNIVNEVSVLYSLSGNTNVVNYQDHLIVKRTDELGWDILIRMEYLTSLSQYMDKNQMSREDILRMGIELCTAIEVCAQKGLVHRDIKDENIFINDSGVFKLGDFGIAKALSQTGRAASARGTPLYMAPEVYRGEKYGSTVDIYLLGMVLYKLFNHDRLPFMPIYPNPIRFSDSEASLERRLRGDSLPPPDQASEEIGKIVQKACSFNPEDRYSSASEMKVNLENILNHLPMESRAELLTIQASSKVQHASLAGSISNGSAGQNGASQKDKLEETESVLRDLGKTESVLNRDYIQGKRDDKSLFSLQEAKFENTSEISVPQSPEINVVASNFENEAFSEIDNGLNSDESVSSSKTDSIIGIVLHKKNKKRIIIGVAMLITLLTTATIVLAIIIPRIGDDKLQEQMTNLLMQGQNDSVPNTSAIESGLTTTPKPTFSQISQTTTTTAATTTAAAGTFELALITDCGNIDDKSFNEGAWNGVKNYAEANGIAYAYYRPSEDSTAAREETIGTAIDTGAKIVVCPGYLFEEAIYNVQDKYPEVQFLLLDGQPHTPDYSTYKTSANVHCILYQEEQAGYLAGYAAVMDGYTKLGFLGGMAVPAVVRYGYGFVQGAEAAATELKLAAGSVEMKYWYCGGFGPTDDIKTKMSGWYTEGTEVVFACGGGIYLSAVASAEAAGAKVIGVDVDQSAQSDLIITSAMKELTKSVELSLTAIYANKGIWPADYAGRTPKLGAAQECVGLPTVATSWKFTTFTVAQYEAVFAKLVDGSVVVDNSSDPTVKPSVKLITVDYQE